MGILEGFRTTTGTDTEIWNQILGTASAIIALDKMLPPAPQLERSA